LHSSSRRHLGVRRYSSSYYYSLPHYRYYSYGYPGYYGYPYYISLPHFKYYYFGNPGYYTQPSSGYRYEYQYDNRPEAAPGSQYEPEGTRQAAEEARDAAERAKRSADEAARAVEYVKASRYLENVARAFAQGDYAKAAEHAREALRSEPENAVLPFVYGQSLFANGQYRESADVLREALRMVHIIDEQGVYYSVGFYPSEDLLTEQIDKLSDAAQAEPDRADLQLVLGYQLLGIGSFDEALDALQKAEYDYVNGQAAKMLIEVLVKSRQQHQQQPEEVEIPEGTTEYKY
jgi:hypothetical protein